MKYQLFGDTGLIVSKLCFGTMTFGGQGIWENIGTVKQDGANAPVKAAFDGGINFFDTANVYSYGESESLLGKSFKDNHINRNDVVIATKVRGRMSEARNNAGLSRYHVMHSVDESLKRLQTDHIDLLYVHGVDPLTPVEEIMRTLNEVVMSGKVRYTGVCNWPAWMVMQAQGIADKHDWHKFKALQYFYSLAGRGAEREIIPMAINQNLPVMPWSPLAGGFLSGKYTREQAKGNGRRDTFDFPPINKEKAYDIIDALIAIGKQHEVSPSTVALSWVAHQPGITSTIIGAKTVKQLEENIACIELVLNEDELKLLNELSAIPDEYPGWMVKRQSADREVK